MLKIDDFHAKFSTLQVDWRYSIEIKWKYRTRFVADDFYHSAFTT